MYACILAIKSFEHYVLSGQGINMTCHLGHLLTSEMDNEHETQIRYSETKCTVMHHLHPLCSYIQPLLDKLNIVRVTTVFVAQRVNLRPLIHSVFVFYLSADGKVYAFGGMGVDTTPQALVRVYETEKDQWQPLTSMPTPRYGATPFVRGNKIYLMGKQDYTINFSHSGFYRFSL